MKAKRFLFLFIFAALWAAWAQADVIPGRWDKVDALAEQSPVVVILKQGDRIEGSLLASTADAVTIQVEPGRQLTLEKQSILKVTSAEKRPDSTRNGTLIGAGVGFGIGFGALVAFEKSETASGFELAEENLNLAILGGLVGCAIGAAAGWAIDKSHTAEEVLYRAP